MDELMQSARAEEGRGGGRGRGGGGRGGGGRYEEEEEWYEEEEDAMMREALARSLRSLPHSASLSLSLSASLRLCVGTSYHTRAICLTSYQLFASCLRPSFQMPPISLHLSCGIPAICSRSCYRMPAIWLRSSYAVPERDLGTGVRREEEARKARVRFGKVRGGTKSMGEVGRVVRERGWEARSLLYLLPTRVLRDLRLSLCYAMSGTGLRACYAMSGD
eukprot:663522-Rhodomonas_salina.1